MSKTLCAVAAAAALAVPAVALGDDNPPSQQNKQNAERYCKALREQSGQDNFRSMFGGGKNAYGKCVSQNAKKDQRQQEKAHDNAAKQCKAERDQLGQDAFRDKYGTGKDKKNAYGKCVSQKAKANKAAADETDQNDVKAAKSCKAEQKDTGDDAFKAKYGTNKNKSNAFGKCVSQQSKKLDQQDQQEDQNGGDNDADDSTQGGTEDGTTP